VYKEAELCELEDFELSKI